MRSPHPDLERFLKPYDPSVISLFHQLRNWIIEAFPEANELIYDAFSAVVIAFSVSDSLDDAFCHLPVYTKYVNLGFNRGALLSDPQKLLKGSGKLIRHIKVKSFDGQPWDEIRRLLQDAESLAIKDAAAAYEIRGQAIVKQISENKRRPS